MCRLVIFVLTCCLGRVLFAQQVGELLINEVVSDPQQDWSSTNFEGGSMPDLGAGSNDDAVEILVLVDGLDLTGWSIELNDGTDVSGSLVAGGAFSVSNYVSSNGGIFTNTKKGDYLVLGNVVGSGEMNNTSLTIVLKSPSGVIIDKVSLGGQSGQAPSGNATSVDNQSVSRIVNGSNTGDNSVDFIKTITTLGEENRYAEVSQYAGSALSIGDQYGCVETDYLGVLGGDDRTLECWVKTTNDGTIFCYGSEVVNQANVLRISNGRLSFSINAAEVVGTTSLIDEEWHHIALVFSGTNINEVIFYVDGQLDVFSSSSSAIINTVASDGLVIGKGFSIEDFSGEIDEVHVWSVARTETEIRSTMHISLLGNETGLELCYQFNQEDGDAKEIKSNYLGDLNGDVSYVESGVHVGKGQVTVHEISGLGTYSSGSTIADYSLEIEFLVEHPDGDLVVSYLNMSPLGMSPSDENHSSGTWVIHNYGVKRSNLDYSMIYRYSDGGVLSSDVSLHHLYTRGSNETGSWGNVGPSCAVSLLTNENYTKFCGLNEFSQFVVSSSVSPLPVDFLNVKAEESSMDVVIVSWSTATELNNDYFTIEKAEDEYVFYPIGEIESIGNTTFQLDYSFEDLAVEEGVSYYRVKQTDINGEVLYSEVVSVDVGEQGSSLVYPNPVKGYLVIESESIFEYFLCSSDLIVQSVPSFKTTERILLDVTSLAKGVYFLKMLIDGKVFTERVVVYE